MGCKDAERVTRDERALLASPTVGSSENAARRERRCARAAHKAGQTAKERPGERISSIDGDRPRHCARTRPGNFSYPIALP